MGPDITPDDVFGDEEENEGGDDSSKFGQREVKDAQLHLTVKGNKKPDETEEEFESRMAARYQGILNGKGHMDAEVSTK